MKELLEGIDIKYTCNMPNEIFNDICNLELETELHKSFIYSYYYLIDIIYRNAIYGFENITNTDIVKAIVKKYSNYSYIISKGGLLDSMGYTESVKEFPIMSYMDDGVLSFVKQKVESNRQFIKFPVKSFSRSDEYLDGTYFDYSNTHKVDFNIFKLCMGNKELGTVGFLIYGYLMYRCSTGKGKCRVSNDRMMEITGIKNDKTVSKYTKKLEEMGLISSDRNVVDGKMYQKTYWTTTTHT